MGVLPVWAALSSQHTTHVPVVVQLKYFSQANLKPALHKPLGVPQQHCQATALCRGNGNKDQWSRYLLGTMGGWRDKKEPSQLPSWLQDHQSRLKCLWCVLQNAYPRQICYCSVSELCSLISVHDCWWNKTEYRQQCQWDLLLQWHYKPIIKICGRDHVRSPHWYWVKSMSIRNWRISNLVM